MTRDEYKQLLEPHLPPPILERAVRNFDEPRCSRCADGQRDLAPHELVNYGFVWSRTLEGDPFWAAVHDRLRGGRYNALPSMKQIPAGG